MKRINVAVGVIQGVDGKILVGQRTVEDQYFQKWEFPGGKLEPNETPPQALMRELSEELGIDVARTVPLITLEHDYPDRHVRLHVLDVAEYRGEISSREGQALRWVTLQELDQLDFLQGNKPIIDCLKTRQAG